MAAKGGLQNDNINADFYASNVDMSLVKNYLPDMDISGMLILVVDCLVI